MSAWIKVDNPNYSPFDGSDTHIYICPICHETNHSATNFCPNCGEDMRETEHT